MKENEYFIINSIEELKKAYYMFEDRWACNLESEIMDFNDGLRHVKCNYTGIFLGYNHYIDIYVEIESPVRNINNLNKLI